MATSTVTQTVMAVTSSISPSATADRATPQSGVLEGSNPSQYNASNPIILFIIQVFVQIFLTMSELLLYAKHADHAFNRLVSLLFFAACSTTLCPSSGNPE
jgi:hypothetical protein